MIGVIEKARKLLRLEERAGTPGEAVAAARALGKLLDKHRITIAQVELRGIADAETIEVPDESLLDFERLPAWKSTLAKKLCRHFGVAYWRRKFERGRDASGRRQYRYAMQLCGRADDIAAVRHMFSWLSIETERLSHASCSGAGSVTHNSWRRGFVDGVTRQLRDARAELAIEHSGAALALVDRYDHARDHMHSHVSGLRTRMRRRHWLESVSAHAAGQRRGQAQHLGALIDDTPAHPAGLQLPEAS